MHWVILLKMKKKKNPEVELTKHFAQEKINHQS